MNASRLAGPHLMAALSCSVVSVAPTAAQPLLDPSGETFNFTGTFEEYRIPNLRGSIIRFSVIGADGGDATVTQNDICFNSGGQGATVTLDTVIGLGTNRLPPNETIRFIVGGAGVTDNNPNNRAGAGGGGGSGIAYTRPGLGEVGDWRVLAVAGGGGGAASRRQASRCTRLDENGLPGQSNSDGADATVGGLGGTMGGGGESNDPDPVSVNGFGGGGAFGSTPLDVEDTTGGAGFQNGEPVGGQGVSTSGDFFEPGGYGFGGGGAARDGGGGGGGYSGGGGGEFARAGGGGGSYTETALAFGLNLIQEGEPNMLEPGRISYSFIGQSHDQRLNALAMEERDGRILSMVGTTVGALPSPIPDVANFDADVWYTYTNTAPCNETIRFTFTDAQVVAIVNDGPPTASIVGGLSVELEPGDTVDLRVAPRFGISFVVEGLILPEGDSDLDGVCDGDDVCPGGADLVDVDDDSVPDACDACPGFDDFADADGDTVADGCDVCPGFDDFADIDSNGVSDCLEDCDGDGIPDGLDGPLDETNLTPIIGFSANDSQTLTFSTCGGANFDTALALWDPNGTLIASNDDADCGAGLSELSQSLPAGSYLLGVLGGPVVFGDTDFEASYDPAGCPGSGPLQLTLSNGVDPSFVANLSIDAGEALLIPISVDEGPTDCLADVNNDGELNGADFNAWLNAFSTDDPAADQNEDGNLDGADFNAWLANFAAGCPD